LNIDRIALRPATKEDSKQLALLHNKKYVYPLDEVLGIDKLPFKLTAAAMLEIAYWVQEVNSYQKAGEGLRKYTPISINDETIRTVANFIGSEVFCADVAVAEAAWNTLNTGKLVFPDDKMKLDHILYIEVDGAMVHTRKENVEEKINDKTINPAGSEENVAKSTWMENKHGMVFSSENFVSHINKDGELEKKIGKREYISYIGPVEILKNIF
jgi:hypothetical protein